LTSPLPVHDPLRMRHAGRELLSLALMDARNHTLRWLSAFEAADTPAAEAVRREFDPPTWLAAQAAWVQEYWIARNVQRQRGEQAEASRPRLPSIEPAADRWFAGVRERAPRWRTGGAPGDDAARLYLAQTLELTLDLLEGVKEDNDDALHFFRLALWHEDRLQELFAALAQAWGLPAAQQRPMWPAELPVRSARPPLHFHAQRWPLGSPRAAGGFVPDAEKWAHEVEVAEFEIDAQAVSWTQFSEFVEDGGYDDSRHWSPEGWAWVEHTGRRCPRHVEQLRHGVLLHRCGRLQRVPGQQAAVHLSVHEAEAWCRWADRRLPTEAEWEIAALLGPTRGLVWADVAEWTMGSARLYPEHAAGPVSPGRELLLPWPGDSTRPLRVLRGASWLTAQRLRHAKARRFATPEEDALFCGFRSCAP